MNEEQILNKTIDHYGKPAQVLKCIEECAELIMELCDVVESNKTGIQIEIDDVSAYASDIHSTVREIATYADDLKSLTLDTSNNKQLLSELADVSITIDEMSNDKLFGSFKEEREFKINRLDKKIKQDG